MEKSKMIQYLNDNFMNFNSKSFVYKITSMNYISDSESNTKSFSIRTEVKFFESDSCGEGFHKSIPQTYVIPDNELKKMQRTFNLDSLLDDSETFDIESEIYSDEQLNKLSKLRDDNKIKLPRCITMKDYYSTFKPGDKVYFNKEAGIITYCHEPNKRGELQFTVKVRGEETTLINPFERLYTRYLSKGRQELRLSKRSVTNYENVEVSEEVKSLSTKELLNYLRLINRSAWDCIPDYIDEMYIRAELSTREHVPNKIEKKQKRNIVKKHGGSKSKNR